MAEMTIRETYNRKKLELAITKARTNKEDYELKILEKRMEIERIENEIKGQDENILKCQAALAEFDNPKPVNNKKK